MPKFSITKAVEGIVFVLSHVEGEFSKVKTLKVLFFADRYNLRRYGTAIFNDKYFAMPMGPVASGIKDVLDHFLKDDGFDLSGEERQYAEDRLSVEGDTLVCRGEFNDYEFSEVEVRSLAWAVENFAAQSHDYLSDLTHIYPEWQKHQKKLDNGSKRVKMSYADFFSNPKCEDSFFQESQELLECSKDYYEENLAIEAMLAF